MPVVALAILHRVCIHSFAFSVRHMGITRANVFTNFIPVFTALFSFIILGDRLTMQNIAGMVIVIAGLMMSQINGRKKKHDEALILMAKQPECAQLIFCCNPVDLVSQQYFIFTLYSYC